MGVVVIWLCVMAGPTSVALAQENDVSLDYSYGTVASVTADALVLKEYDFEADAEVEVTYIINKDIELNNIDSLEQIQPGDSIDVLFAEENGQKVAKMVTREDLDMGEEMMEEPPMEPDTEEGTVEGTAPELAPEAQQAEPPAGEMPAEPAAEAIP